MTVWTHPTSRAWNRLELSEGDKSHDAIIAVEGRLTGRVRTIARVKGAIRELETPSGHRVWLRHRDLKRMGYDVAQRKVAQQRDIHGDWGPAKTFGNQHNERG